MNNSVSLQQACEWIKDKFEIDVSISNLSYLVQYGQIRKFNSNGQTRVLIEDLNVYYSRLMNRAADWQKNLGKNLNWHLSFEKVTEKDRTKHVHRLHPYKGKFIPQLVEYFLDSHTDEFKEVVFFTPGDIVLDPFCGSGTTLVQANELGINAIGIDISEFNSLISNVKIQKHEFNRITQEVVRITIALNQQPETDIYKLFDKELLSTLSEYNKQFFPSPEYVYQVRNNRIDQFNYAREKEKEFKLFFYELINKYGIKVKQANINFSFLEKWFLYPVRKEIDLVNSLINEINHEDTKKVLRIILSRTMRSCRATTHADLATLIDPISEPYYCQKHYKICKPIFSINYWWGYYSKDTIKRLKEFEKIRTNTFQYCLTGDSRTLDIEMNLKSNFPNNPISGRKIRGIFTSPPYIGMIDYHEQHAYAYEMLGLPRRDNQEIGRLSKGKNGGAKNDYIEGIVSVLLNCKKYLDDDSNIFIVANDNQNIYPRIIDRSGMKIIREYLRPVLCRTEKDKSEYSETIFHIKSN